MSLGRKVAHFSVTHPLGMHARVCSRWVKAISKMRPPGLDFAKEWVWIEYKGECIVADSLFRLLEARIPCGAEFDLFLDESFLYDEFVNSDLKSIISLEACELTSTVSG